MKQTSVWPVEILVDKRNVIVNLRVIWSYIRKFIVVRRSLIVVRSFEIDVTKLIPCGEVIGIVSHGAKPLIGSPIPAHSPAFRKSYHRIGTLERKVTLKQVVEPVHRTGKHHTNAPVNNRFPAKLREKLICLS
jgi:hypothetical protein